MRGMGDDAVRAVISPSKHSHKESVSVSGSHAVRNGRFTDYNQTLFIFMNISCSAGILKIDNQLLAAWNDKPIQNYGQSQDRVFHFRFIRQQEVMRSLRGRRSKVVFPAAWREAAQRSHQHSPQGIRTPGPSRGVKAEREQIPLSAQYCAREPTLTRFTARSNARRQLHVIRPLRVQENNRATWTYSGDNEVVVAQPNRFVSEAFHAAFPSLCEQHRNEAALVLDVNSEWATSLGITWLVESLSAVFHAGIQVADLYADLHGRRMMRALTESRVPFGGTTLLRCSDDSQQRYFELQRVG
ncbi:hypothetical protein F2P81_007310 [Scophthalmus maximus]|uniref:Uncharacterized protein n=1 Tax=Scophthalmus maximus TaxID=52904 RepID=A0A6A4TH19_SCOMX|nr:hypothetical protein F2P81_007310 [Scophthalmus maximus]